MARNPRLVYCSLSAFGPQGRRGTDVALQSESGLVTANGGRVIPVPAHDTVVPWIMVAGILAALIERERSGQGQRVETSLLEASAALAAHRLIREGSGEPLFNRFVGAMYRPYPTSDGALSLACYAPRLHARALAGPRPRRPARRPPLRRAARPCPPLRRARRAHRRTPARGHHRRLAGGPQGGRAAPRRGEPHPLGGARPPRRRRPRAGGATWRTRRSGPRRSPGRPCGCRARRPAPAAPRRVSASTRRR